MKRLLISLSIVLALLITSITSSSVVFAEEKTARESFNENYIEYENNYVNAEITDQNVDYFIESTFKLLGDAENLIYSMSSEEYLEDVDLKGKYRILLTNCGDLCKIKVDNNYHPEDYSYSTNGSIRLNNEYFNCCKVFANPKNKQDLLSAYNSYFELLNSGELAYNVNKLTTPSDSAIKGEITSKDGSLIFSQDDKFIVKNYNSKSQIKNLNNLLISDEDCDIDNPGVAYYFDLKYYKDGIICEDEFDNLINVKISLASVNILDIEDGENIKIVVYENGKITYIDGVVESQHVSFNIQKFGKYALVAKDYKPNNLNYVATFINKNKTLLIILGCILLFFVFFFKLKRSAKKRRQKRELKEFKAHKKQQLREETVKNNKTKVKKKKY